MALHLSNALLFVITWIVQLWIYPNLSRPEDQRFFSYSWYKAFIVILTLPAMTVQCVMHSINFFNQPGWIHTAQWCGTMSTLILTFGFAVPLHLKMTREGISDARVKELLRIHSLRTISWTIIFLLDFIKFRI